jgi:thiamine biosynthesis lipoprotein
MYEMFDVCTLCLFSIYSEERWRSKSGETSLYNGRVHMRRVAVALIAVLFIGFTISGCQKKPENEYTKYTRSFFETFDTVVTVVAYTKNEDEFNAYFEKIQVRFEHLHKLYDIYNEYEGLNNIKTINDNAGIKAVKVDKEIIDLILFAKDWNRYTNGKLNIALGPVLSIWHDYREKGKNEPQSAKLPSLEELRVAAEHTDIDQVIVDVENSTVFLADKNMKLDVGGVAKGYATEIVAKEIMGDGLKSGIINAGGNIRVLEDKPYDGIRERWGIGIQDPDKPILPDGSNYLDVVFINNASVVNSGDYERYYIVDDKRIHHLIDPETLMPGDYYRAVTIVAEHSGIADVLSTAVFLMPYEQSFAFVEGMEDVDAMWIMKDGEIRATDGMKNIMRSNGATGRKAK